MAVGDLIVADWQMERGGLLIGDTTDYDIRQISGLASLPEVRPQDRPLLLRHGSVPGLDYLGVRSFSVDLELIDETSSSLSTKLATLGAAFQSEAAESVIAFQVPGIAGGVKAQVSGRVRRRDVPVGLEFAYGMAQASFEVVCSDPRIYSQVENTDNVGLATSGGGLTFNASPNFTFGATSTGGTLNISNAGNFDAPVSFRIDGPITNPIIESVTTGKTLSFTITLATGEFLVVDSSARTVLLAGTASRYYTLDVGSEWFDLEPDTNEISFRADAATAATLTATWRDAWS